MPNYPYRKIGIELDLSNWDTVNDNYSKIAEDIETVGQAAFDEVVGEAKLVWKEPVQTFAALETVYPNPEQGWTVFVRNSGVDGETYRFDGTQWSKIQEFDASAINEVDTRLTADLAVIGTEVDTINSELPKKANKLNSAILSSLGAISSLNLGLKRNLLYNPPSAFVWQNSPVKNRIFSDGEGNFATDFDASELAPTGKKYYVNGTTGLDTNDGLTAGTALKSVHIAGKKTDAVEIIVASGYYDDGVAFNGWAIDKNLSIKAAAGADVTLSTRRNQAGVWVKTAGYTNIYQVTRSLVSKVFDKKFQDSFGDDREYTAVSSLAELDSAPGRFFISGSILYVHTSDSRLPDVDVTVYLDLYNLSHFGGKTIYLENIKLEGGKYPVFLRNDANLDTLFLSKNCTFKYSSEAGSDGLSNYGCTSILQSCIVSKNSDDGISYTAFGTKPTQGIEINCISKNNGASGGNDNGTTAHDGANVIRVNGAYYKNKGPNLADVGGSQSWNVGCVIGESAGTVGQSSHRGSTSSKNSGVGGTKIWLDGCTIYGNTTDIHTDDECFTYTRNTKYITSNEAQIQY